MLKKMIAMLLVVIMIGGAAPLGALAELDWPTLQDGIIMSWLNDEMNTVKDIASQLYSKLRGLSFYVKAAEKSGSCGDNLTWTFNSETGVLTISGEGAMNDFYYLENSSYLRYSIPWFSVCTNILSVLIDDGITSIGNYAFYGCSRITEINLPDSIIRIGENAFKDCSGIIEIELPDNVTSIEKNAFKNCSGITEISIPDGVANIGENVFDGCSGLSFLLFNATNCTSVRSNAFSGCVALQTVTVGDSVTIIPSNAFHGCKSIKDITIPDSVTTIGDSAFFGCIGIEKITIPNSVTRIESFAFHSCTGIEEITISENVTSIGYDAFNSCVSITKITIPNSVTSIGAGAFRDCTSLESITLPFVGLSANATGKDAVFGAIFGDTSYSSTSNNTVKQQYASSYSSVSYYYIPSSLRSVKLTNCASIPYGAFDNCSMLTEITIPECTKEICRNAFRGCTGLLSVSFKAENCVTFDSPYFSDCTSLQNLSVGETVLSIPSGFLYNCPSISEITLPDSVTDIGQNAFYQCTRLAHIKLSANLRHIGSGAFFGTVLYTDATNWTDGVLYIDNCLISTNHVLSGTYCVRKGTVCIADNALQDCDNLSILEIPASVIGIGFGILTGCTKLKAIHVDADNTFYYSDEAGILFNAERTMILCYPANCPAVQFSIPDSVKEIANRAFYGCRNLTVVSIPDSVTRIGESAFYNCRQLSSVNIPVSLTEIEDYTFDNCRLKEIILGDAVTHIGDYAFAWNSLENVTFGPSVQYIGLSVFSGSNLQSVCYFGTVEDWLSIKIEDTNGVLLQAPRYYHTHDDSLQTEVRNAVDATCYYEGYSGDIVYLPCGALKEKGQTIPATGHDWDEGTVTREPTCTRDGITTFTCKNDSLHTRTESIPATGHDWDDGTVTREPSCTREGTITYTCKNDESHTYYESIPAPGHDFVITETPATCTEIGQVTVICSRCGQHDWSSESHSPSLGHNWDNGVVTREPSCTETGIILFICKRDASHTREEYTPAKGHIFGAWQQTKAPTAEAEGEAQRRCSVCGDVETITLAKLPAPEKLTLSKTSVTLNYKDSETLTASEAVTWTSSNEKIVKVDAVTGKLTTVGKGTATVTAHSVQGDKTATCEVTVKYTFIQILIRIFLLGFIWY